MSAEGNHLTSDFRLITQNLSVSLLISETIHGNTGGGNIEAGC